MVRRRRARCLVTTAVNREQQKAKSLFSKHLAGNRRAADAEPRKRCLGTMQRCNCWMPNALRSRQHEYGRPFHQNGETAARGPSIAPRPSGGVRIPPQPLEAGAAGRTAQQAVIAAQANPNGRLRWRCCGFARPPRIQNYAKNSLFSRRGTKNVSPAKGRILPVSGLQPTSNGVLGAP